ncbi:hypothetical protein SANT12839_072360 [Streptomyces antimycoticus]|uniref:Uncharacterized protein n=1 Tax=Streptomyces antimycoticus TaxID=68175 RepID=A0A4D4KDW8_9ACTN|nr:hypothetical protein SANT12839_072360 [Streptomyces antimycoticus]
MGDLAGHVGGECGPDAVVHAVHLVEGAQRGQGVVGPDGAVGRVRVVRRTLVATGCLAPTALGHLGAATVR